MNLIIVVNSDEGGEQFFSTNITRRVTVGTNLVMNEEWTSLSYVLYIFKVTVSTIFHNF
jgi:hypothetical protein